MRLVLRDLDPLQTANLGPGEYYLHLSAPERVLNAFVYNQRVASSIVSYLASRVSARVEMLGGGTAWDTVPDSNIQRRVLIFRFRVSEPNDGLVLAALTPTAWVSLAVIIAAIAVALSVTVGVLGVERIIQELPEETRIDIGEAIANTSAGFRALALGALLFGGFWAAERYGLLRGARA